MVTLPNAIIDPVAMMIEAVHTLIANVAMLYIGSDYDFAVGTEAFWMKMCQ